MKVSVEQAKEQIKKNWPVFVVVPRRGKFVVTPWAADGMCGSILGEGDTEEAAILNAASSHSSIASPEEIDWNDDEAVVKAAVPSAVQDAYSRAIWFDNERGEHTLLGLDWKSARMNLRVQGWESASRPLVAIPVDEPERTLTYSQVRQIVRAAAGLIDMNAVQAKLFTQTVDAVLDAPAAPITPSADALVEALITVLRKVRAVPYLHMHLIDEIDAVIKEAKNHA